MRILGLDPSLSSTGWGIIEVIGNKMKYYAYAQLMPMAKKAKIKLIKKLR